MLLAALRDLQWRRRRFVITVLGTALVFAMSLLMSGLSNAFTVEIEQTLDDQRASAWISRDNVAGAFSPGSFLGPDDVAAIEAALAPENQASPLLFAAATARIDGAVRNVNVMGLNSGGLGTFTHVSSGVTELSTGSVIVPKSLDLDVGDAFDISGTSFTVSGVVDNASLIAGTPTVLMPLADAQQLLFAGQPRVSMMLATGDLEVPGGYRAFTRAEVEADLIRPLKNPIASIDFIKVLLWMVAALIVASVVYLTVLERTRDIAVFKATGSSTWSIGLGICLQAVILAVLASILGIILATLLAPRFPMEVAVSTRSMILLPVLAVGVGVLAGLIGVRRTVRVEPATAFGGP
ncbi:MAG: ABC transporter permease [Ilumatobacteraceae bacterium]